MQQPATATIAEMISKTGIPLVLKNGNGTTGANGVKSPSAQQVVPPSTISTAFSMPVVPAIKVSLREDLQKVGEFERKLIEFLDESAPNYWEYQGTDDKNKWMIRDQFESVMDEVRKVLDYDGVWGELAKMHWLISLIKYAPVSQNASEHIAEIGLALAVLNRVDREGSDVIIGSDGYNVDDEFANNPMVDRLVNDFRTFSSKSHKAMKECYKKEVSKLLPEEGTGITVSDLRAGKQGQIVLVVPPYQLMDREGNLSFKKSGSILVQSKNGVIHLLDVAGPISETAQNVISRHVWIEIRNIPSQKPGPSHKVEFGRQIPRDYFIPTICLWRWVVEGVFSAEEDAKSKVLADAQSDQFDRWRKETLSGVQQQEEILSPKEWLLEHKDGLFFFEREKFARPIDDLNIRWFVEAGGQRVNHSELNPMAVICRRGGAIQLVSCPKHQNRFWEGIKDPQAEGSAFEGLPWQIKIVLKMAFKNTTLKQNSR